MNSTIRKILYGDAHIREYATITVANGITEGVYLQMNETITEVSQNQFLLSLDPMVFGVWVQNDEDTLPRDCKLYFTDTTGGSDKIAKNITADVSLNFLNSIAGNNGRLLLLQVTTAGIHHINKFRIQLLFSKFYKNPKLRFSQFKALVSAFSYPRRVRIVGIRQGDYYNIFPMDLLGDMMQDGKYVFGLRHTNAALSKIIEAKKIVVAEVSYPYKDIIYQLGKHHGSTPPPVAELPFKVISSKNFGFYMPEWVDSYKEIKIITTQDLGSQMLLWGEVFNEVVLKEPIGHLYHIHFLLYLHQKRKGVFYSHI